MNAERTSFAIDEEAPDLVQEEIAWADITQAVDEQSKQYLKPFTDPIRDEKRRKIETFVATRAPMYRPIMPYIQDEIDRIDPDADDDTMDLELYKAYHEVAVKTKEEGTTLLKEEAQAAESLDDFEGRLEAYFEKVSDLNMADLARQELVDRTDPHAEIRDSYVWYLGARFLVRHGRTDTVRQMLPNIESLHLGELAILALEYLPDLAVDAFRRALRSLIPANRITAAAALAIVDQAWSRSELTAVLGETDDHELTSECRSALMTTHCTKSHQAVVDWEERNPRTAEPGPYISFREMMLRQGDETINSEMEQLHDRVILLRGREPNLY